MAAPDFYRTSLTAIDAMLKTVSRGTVREIGRSVGGRPIHAVAYGEFEPVKHAANLSSALAGRKPEAFFGEGERQKQVLLITSAIHGGEMESIAAVLNLISLMETGKDLRGQEWPELVASAERLRLVIVPCLNPDGRGRIPVDDPTIWTEAEFEKYRHGLHADGSFIRWPACKHVHPRDPKVDGFLGGYFNDAGVNPLHGVPFSPEIAPETHAGLALAVAETPDMLLDLHSCENGPFCIAGDRFLPQSYNWRAHYFDGFYRRALWDKMKIEPSAAGAGFEGALTFPAACFHYSGALPLIFEGADGAHEGSRYTYAEILDSYLVLFEALMTAGVHGGFKPRMAW